MADDLLVAIRAEPPRARGRRRVRRWLAIGAAAALTLVAVAQYTVWAPGEDPHRTLTLERVARALADVPLLPGAKRHDDAPDAALVGAGTQPANGDHGVHRTGWWTAPVHPVDAVRYFRSHVPAHFTLAGSGGVAGVVTLDYYGPSDAATQGLETHVTVIDHDSGVAVRVDAYAVWLPTRPAASLIRNPSRVDVVVSRGDLAPTVRRVLIGAAARHLAEAANHLWSPSTIFYVGGPTRSDAVDTLHFVTPHGSFDVRATFDGVELRAPGGKRYDLQAGSLDDTVVATLGLPAGYGSL